MVVTAEYKVVNLNQFAKGLRSKACKGALLAAITNTGTVNTGDVCLVLIALIIVVQ